jgi:DNA-binding CsgD family transcriptional regulator
LRLSALLSASRLLVPTPETLEHALDGREAAEALTSLPGREALYLALFAAGYTYHEIAEREGVTYMNVNKHLARANRRAPAGRPLRPTSPYGALAPPCPSRTHAAPTRQGATEIAEATTARPKRLVSDTPASASACSPARASTAACGSATSRLTAAGAAT